MEAALMALRVAVVRRRVEPVRIAEAAYAVALVPYVAIDGHWTRQPDDLRAYRARVAIALRAALRADDDARCEEALASAGYGEETGATPGDGWDTGYDEGAEAVAHRLREWPVLDRGWWDRVPLALWERT
jgi:hypothetical protein